MGTIIGEGITFDDVLLVPQYSEVTPKPDRSEDTSDKEDRTEHSYDECSHGYRYGVKNGDCNGKTGWYRNHS